MYQRKGKKEKREATKQELHVTLKKHLVSLARTKCRMQRGHGKYGSSRPQVHFLAAYGLESLWGVLETRWQSHHPCLADLHAESAAPSLCWNGRSEEQAEKAEAPRMSTKYWSYKPQTKSEGDQNRMLLDADGCGRFSHNFILIAIWKVSPCPADAVAR